MHNPKQVFMLLIFANGPGDQGSIPDRVIPKTKKCLTLSIKK